MGKIEKEFGALKEKYFANKAASIQNEIELIESGKHEQFLSREKALRKKMEDALESAARERTYQIHNAQLVYEGEAVQAEKDYQMDRKHLKKKMREALEQRLEELEEEKKNVSVVDYSTKKMTEEAQGGAYDGKAKKKKKLNDNLPAVVVGDFRDGRKRRINPPHVNYTIRDSDIYNDIHLLRRGPFPRAQLENILYDVYASGNDSLTYYEKQFDVGSACTVTDREGNALYDGVVEVVSPIELKLKTKAGASQSIALSDLRDGQYCLLRP